MRKKPTAPTLLSREEFTTAVLERDGHACVLCGAKASDGARLDAHHIIERRLWSDGGYYLENGATVCDRGETGCHYACERTDISVETLREKCGVQRIALPDDLYPDHVYDKWGNGILEDGRRTKGPLFDDPSVQKVIAEKLPLFTPYVKYPRTWHLPWSPGATDDDRMLRSVDHFEGRRVIVTRKMDGENFSGYQNHSHARSIDGRHHASRDWAKTAWAQRSWQIPDDWRFVMENLYAVHSLRYDTLPSYLMGLSVWDHRNICLSWDETVEWFTLIDLPVVEVLHDGVWSEALIRRLHAPSDDARHEGYVVRLADAFAYRDFGVSVAKYVRANHVTTDRHWMRGRRVEPNGLAAQEPVSDEG